ncbi:MAG TPA: hypothetical protein VF165_19190 [Nocardioidaceae bacterium]
MSDCDSSPHAAAGPPPSVVVDYDPGWASDFDLQELLAAARRT